MGNALTAVGGFALASKGHINYWLFLATVVGLSLVIASACVFNNYIDRYADAKMKRTQNRALAKGLISIKMALSFAVVLGLLGISILALYTNLFAVFISLFGFFIYVVLYSLWKYRTSYATVIGSISGAVPPVIGYCAVSNSLDIGAILLFMIMVLWQMPHFYAIAMYRFDDYLAVSMPVLPVKKGPFLTKIQMLFYIIAFIVAALMLTVLGYTGYMYTIVAVLFGCTWLWLCIKGFKSNNDKIWARQMFVVSLVVITALCTALILSGHLQPNPSSVLAWSL
jgi:protoheme IX farnesyltransferase